MPEQSELQKATEELLKWYYGRSVGFRVRCDQKVFDNLTKALRAENGLTNKELIRTIEEDNKERVRLA